MIAYLDANGLLPSHQSALRKNHSTETLLIRLLSDLYGAMETGKISLLTHFDVSSAFDSVEHSILLHRLYISFGLTDKSLQWLSSFLSDSGVHPPEAMMHFPLCFRFPPTLEQFSFSVENFQNFTFSRKISRLSSVKISDDFFSHRPQISNFLLFSLFQCISLCFAKIIISPYFEKFPPCFRKIHLLFTYLMCISFPPTLTMMHLCITQCTYSTGRPCCQSAQTVLSLVLLYLPMGICLSQCPSWLCTWAAPLHHLHGGYWGFAWDLRAFTSAVRLC